MKAVSKIGLILAVVCFAVNANAEEVVEFSLEVAEGGSGVLIGGEPAEEGDIINQDNIGEVDFGDGVALFVRNRKTGIVYAVPKLATLRYLGNALGTNTRGSIIGSWVVGGGVPSNEKSTLLALKNRLGVNVADQVNTDIPVGTPVEP